MQASLVSGDIGDSGGEDECPLRLTSVEVLVGLIRCPLCNCHQVLLDGETVLYKVTPETPVMSVVVGNDLSIQGGGGVALSIGSSAAQGGITVNKGGLRTSFPSLTTGFFLTGGWMGVLRRVLAEVREHLSGYRPGGA